WTRDGRKCTPTGKKTRGINVDTRAVDFEDVIIVVRLLSVHDDITCSGLLRWSILISEVLHHPLQ
ncbi:hypothetical protein PMAYCL1PPCAC_22382, partial [Pristionchus mayeri]